MRENLKKLSKGTAVYGLGHILTRSLAFILLPLYTNYFTPAELGIVMLIAAFLAVMNLFYIYGFDSAFLRFYIREKEAVEQKVIFTTCYLTILTSSLVFSLIIYQTSPLIASSLTGSENFSSLIKITPAILSFDALSYLPLLLLRAREQAARFISIKIIAVVLNVFLNIVFVVWLHKGIAGVFYAQLGASIATFSLTIPVMLPVLRLIYSLSQLKQHLAFGLPYLPTTFAVILMELIDRFFLLQFRGAAEVGIYSAGYRLAMIMSLLIAGFRFAWHPFFLSIAGQKDVKQFFARVLTYFLLVCAFIYLFFSFFIDTIVHLKFADIYLFDAAYWQSTAVVPVVMLAYIFFGVYAIFVVGLHLEKKTKYLPGITFVGALTNIVGNLLLIPQFGMMGAAWATVFSYATMTFVLYILAQKVYPTPYEFLRVMKIIIIVLFIYIVNSSLQLAILYKVFLIAGLPLWLYLLKFWQAGELLFLSKLRDGMIARIKQWRNQAIH